MPTTSKYRVIINQECLALLFISVHPDDSTRKVATILPLDKQGSWAQGQDVDVTMGRPIYNFFSADATDAQIQNELATAAGLPTDAISFVSFP
jgi:hypothetical protein